MNPKDIVKSAWVRVVAVAAGVAAVAGLVTGSSTICDALGLEFCSTPAPELSATILSSEVNTATYEEFVALGPAEADLRTLPPETPGLLIRVNIRVTGYKGQSVEVSATLQENSRVQPLEVLTDRANVELGALSETRTPRVWVQLPPKGCEACTIRIVVADSSGTELASQPETIGALPSDWRRLRRFEAITSLGDLDDDGLPALLGLLPGGTAEVVEVNLDVGTLSTPERLPGVWAFDRLVSLGDVDGDGTTEILATRGHQGKVLDLTRDGRRVDRKKTGRNWLYEQLVSIEDANGDGRRDLVGFNDDDDDQVLYLDPDGVFHVSETNSDDLDEFGNLDAAAAIGTVMGDPRPDLFTLRNGRAYLLHLGESGAYDITRLGSTGSYSRLITLTAPGVEGPAKSSRWVGRPHALLTSLDKASFEPFATTSDLIQPRESSLDADHQSELEPAPRCRRCRSPRPAPADSRNSDTQTAPAATGPKPAHTPAPADPAVCPPRQSKYPAMTVFASSSGNGSSATLSSATCTPHLAQLDLAVPTQRTQSNRRRRPTIPCAEVTPLPSTGPYDREQDAGGGEAGSASS